MSKDRFYPKKILCLALVFVITFSSVSLSYYRTTYSAEYVAGIVGAIGGAPVLTALLIGGVVVAGGIALYELSQTSVEDHRNFVDGVKTGFNEFVAAQEKQIALEQDQSLTDQEASDIGVANARGIVNDFFENTMTGVRNTTGLVKATAQEYWNLYCSIMGNIADNGINTDTEITPTTTVFAPIVGGSNGSTTMTNIGSNCLKINNAYYIKQGNYFLGTQKNFVNASHTWLPFMVCNSSDHVATVWNLVIENNNIGISRADSGWYIYDSSSYNTILQNTNIPIVTGNYPNDSWRTFVTENWQTAFKVGGSVSEAKNYERTIKNTLDNTHIGNSIQTGRQQLVNEGDYIYTAFVQDSVPVKKSGVQVQEGVVSAPVGWDIPLGDVWDDYLTGKKPYSDVVGGLNSLGVPQNDVTGTKDNDRTIEFPDSTPVQDSSDYPKSNTGENDKPESIPDRPAQDVFESQGGSFYPATMDLTQLFPFCIPFDIIYLVDKFNIPAETPVITFTIPYPNSIKGSLGSDGYEVVIDFNDYSTLAMIIKSFLLILFIVGLMQITRQLIRG